MKITKWAKEGNNIPDTVDESVDNGFPRGGVGEFPYRLGSHLIGKLLVYADESGMHENPTWVMVLGYIAAPDVWDAFEIAWQDVLNGSGIKVFHARDFFPGRNPYRDWPGEKRDKFLADLLDVIIQAEIYQVGRAIGYDAFMAQPVWFRRYLTGSRLTTSGKMPYTGAPNDPYQMAFVELMVEALDKAKDSDLVHFTLSQQTEMEGYAVGHMNRIRTIMEEQGDPRASKLGAIAYSTPAIDKALQAADLLNYTVYERFTRSRLKGRINLAVEDLAKKKGTVTRWEDRTFKAARDFVESKLDPEALAKLQAMEK